MPDGDNKAISVFLSYSHQVYDKVVCNDLFDNLRLQDLDVKKDEYDLAPGENLQESIGKLISETHYSIVIISENSLQSAWVIWEIRKRLANPSSQLLPVYIDKSFLDDRFANNILAKLQADIDTLVKEISALNTKGTATAHLDAKKQNLFEFKDNFSGLIEYIRASNVIDLRPENYEQGFLSIYKAMTGTPSLKRANIKLPLNKNADIESRKEEIQNLLAEDLLEAARRTIDFTKQFHKNNNNLLKTAIQICAKVNNTPKFVTDGGEVIKSYDQLVSDIFDLINTPPNAQYVVAE